MKKVTVIGGGTGNFVVLTGLKNYPLDLSVIVTMMDSGGSTGRLRDQLGVLPPGDLRQCLVALSDAPLLWRKLFLYRFENGDLSGHNFGNIFISALEKVAPNYDEVIDLASYILKTKGKVIPVTFDKAHVCVEYENGKILKGENNIDENNSEKSRIKNAFLEPEASPNPKTIKTIAESDYIIVSPGDLYTSIIPVFLVKGIKKAINSSKAKIIYVLNLMSKSGQTDNYCASDFLADLKTYLGRLPNFIIINNGKIPENVIKWYKEHDEKEVVNNLNEDNYLGKVTVDSIVDTKIVKMNGADKLSRSILRHDPKKLAKIILSLIS